MAKACNAGKRWKTTIGLISKSNFARATHFFVHFFAIVWHDYNVKLLWRKCHTCSRSLFLTAAHLHLALVAASISHLTAATKFACCSSNKKMSPLFFISRFKSLSPFFSLSFAGLPPTFSFSLSFSCSIFQICGHDNLSKLNTLVFIDSFVVSALQDAGGYVISRQNNLELHLGYHTCWLSYFTLVYLWCGQTVSRAGGRCTVKWLPNFLGWVVYFIFLPMVLRYETIFLQLLFRAPWLCKSFWLWFDRTFLLAS